MVHLDSQRPLPLVVDGAGIIASARAVSGKILRRASLSKIFEKFFQNLRLAVFHLTFAVSQNLPILIWRFPSLKFPRLPTHFFQTQKSVSP